MKPLALAHEEDVVTVYRQAIQEDLRRIQVPGARVLWA